MGLFSSISKAVKSVGEAVTNPKKALDKAKEWGDKIGDGFKKVGKGIAKGAKAVGKGFAKAGNWVADKTGKAVQFVADKTGDIAKYAGAGLTAVTGIQAFEDAGNSVNDFTDDQLGPAMSRALTAPIRAVAGMPQAMMEKGIVDGFVSQGAEFVQDTVGAGARLVGGEKAEAKFDKWYDEKAQVWIEMAGGVAGRVALMMVPGGQAIVAADVASEFASLGYRAGNGEKLEWYDYLDAGMGAATMGTGSGVGSGIAKGVAAGAKTGAKTAVKEGAEVAAKEGAKMAGKEAAELSAKELAERAAKEAASSKSLYQRTMGKVGLSEAHKQSAIDAGIAAAKKNGGKSINKAVLSDKTVQKYAAREMAVDFAGEVALGKVVEKGMEHMMKPPNGVPPAPELPMYAPDGTPYGYAMEGSPHGDPYGYAPTGYGAESYSYAPDASLSSYGVASAELPTSSHFSQVPSSSHVPMAQVVTSSTYTNLPVATGVPMGQAVYAY